MSEFTPEALADYWYSFRNSAFRRLRGVFRESEMSTYNIAGVLNSRPVSVKRWLNGEKAISMRTMNNIARAMGYRMEITFVPCKEVISKINEGE